ncbi:hypothetical protein M9194_20165 [Vibrio sp. S4M6]|uniref:hypothetical protein n=1 Tax=Vibrio sinus TaxID=2946865 RepID=UPI00202AA4EE|nr:hypothetical protein [Vibrio sinus]MCL9783744.1 hypothetical protein [Vibrio sinus]
MSNNKKTCPYKHNNFVVSEENNKRISKQPKIMTIRKRIEDIKEKIEFDKNWEL